MLNLRIPAAVAICSATFGMFAGVASPANSPQRIFASDGRPTTDSFFPIAVWLQSPVNASRFQSAGINLYVGLWKGPTPEQLNQLQKAHTDINRPIHELAPVLNSPTITNRLTVTSTNSAAQAAAMLKRYHDALFIFAVNLGNEPTRGTFTLHDLQPGSEAEVLGESRRIPVRDGSFNDEFAPYAVHLYRCSPGHRTHTISLLHRGQSVSIAGQEPAAVGLFAVYRDTMPGEVRRFPAGALGHRQCVPAPRVSDFTCNHDLLQLTGAMDPRPLVGGREGE